jgi:hypothetical protein
MWPRPQKPFQIKWKKVNLNEAIKRVPKGDFTYNSLYEQVDTAFQWGKIFSEFKDYPREDRVVMIAYVRASRQMEAIRSFEARPKG